MNACENSNNTVLDHFPEVRKIVKTRVQQLNIN